MNRQWNVNVAHCTHPGLVRDANEDYLGCDESWGLFMVADGVGGGAAGELASRLAVETALDYVRKRLGAGLDPSGILSASFQKANREVREAAESEPSFSGMATTLVAWLRAGDSVYVANTGDSRCYLLQEEKLRQVTKDHSWVQDMISMGVLRANDASAHPYRNMITRCIGMEKTLIVDVDRFPINDRDRWLLCTDGLTNLVKDEEIEEILCEADSDPDALCETMMLEAMQNGGTDNVTVLLVDCVRATEEGTIREARVPE